MKWLLQIKNGVPTATSQAQKAEFDAWKHGNEGKYIVVTPYEKISKSKRGYFEGAIIPAYCAWHEALDPKNPDHRELVREMFKTEFNGTLIKGMWDEPRKIARSTAKLSNDEFGNFLNRITAYFEENQIPIPDPELWKRWADMFQDEFPDYWLFLERNNLKPDGTKNGL